MLFSVFAEILKRDVTIYGPEALITLKEGSKVSTFTQNKKVHISLHIRLDSPDEKRVALLDAGSELFDPNGQFIGVTISQVKAYYFKGNIYGIMGTTDLPFKELFGVSLKNVLFNKAMNSKRPLTANSFAVYLFNYAKERISYRNYFIALDKEIWYSNQFARFDHFLFSRDRDLVAIISLNDLDILCPRKKLPGTPLYIYIISDQEPDHQVALKDYLRDFTKYSFDYAF
jgi:hypothetical protein